MALVCCSERLTWSRHSALHRPLIPRPGICRLRLLQCRAVSDKDEVVSKVLERLEQKLDAGNAANATAMASVEKNVASLEKNVATLQRQLGGIVEDNARSHITDLFGSDYQRPLLVQSLQDLVPFLPAEVVQPDPQRPQPLTHPLMHAKKLAKYLLDEDIPTKLLLKLKDVVEVRLPLCVVP